LSGAVDANLLLYASDTASDSHERAQSALRRYANGPELLYVFWPVAMSYLRIATHPAIFESPLSVDDAMFNMESLIGLPHVRSPGEAEGFWETYRSVVGRVAVRGNLVSDAHLVGLMRQNGVGTIYTHDRDFRRFDGIRVVDPLD
jgi:uncharacterized protein